MKKQFIADNVIRLLAKKNAALAINEISKDLGIKSGSDNFPALLEAVEDLTNQGILVKSNRRKYSLNDYSEDNVIGVFSVRQDRGIVNTKLPHISKIAIKINNMGTALDGDTVAVKITDRKKDKVMGEIVDIISRAKHSVAGTVEFDGSWYFLVPNDTDKYRTDFNIPKEKLNGATPGDKVIGDFLEWKHPDHSPQVEITKITGTAGNPTDEFSSVLQEYNLNPVFPNDTLAEAVKAATFPPDDQIANRLDLRDKKIVTIDPKDARDFDDAVSLETKPNGNLLLGVHIADVSFYVKPDSALDREAQKRGNSVYLVDRVIPMLPEELSNNMCSLMPNVQILTFSVIMEFDSDLNIVNYVIRESVIKSCRRFCYEEVQEILDKGEGELAEMLIPLHQLAERLRAKRFADGGIDFQTQEINFQLDNNKYPQSASIHESTPATQLIEECMLIANKTVAEHINKISPNSGDENAKLLPFLYRIHAEPLPEKLETTLEFIKTLLPPGQYFDIRTSKDINKLIDLFKGKPEESIVSQLLVRSMPKAEYSDENIGHYGLGFPFYAHFTSPIRRYADLTVHRLLKEYNAGIPEISRQNEIEYSLDGIGEHLTETERGAMEAERASDKVAQALLAKKYLGTTFNGTVTGLTEYGLYVLCDDILCEGLLKMSSLSDDYYIYDERNYRIFGKRNKTVYHFGSRLRVKMAVVKIDKRQIDLDFVASEPFIEDKKECSPES